MEPHLKNLVVSNLCYCFYAIRFVTNFLMFLVRFGEFAQHIPNYSLISQLMDCKIIDVIDANTPDERYFVVDDCFHYNVNDLRLAFETDLYYLPNI